MRQPQRQSGFTLIEVATTVGILGVLSAVAWAQLGSWREAEAARNTARSIEGVFSVARSEAIRTGNNHVVFFQQDIATNPLLDGSGDAVPILILDDGRPGSTDQNCAIDSGEPIRTAELQNGVGFGTTNASAKVPMDDGPVAITSGSTFADTSGNPATWVMFGPDGVPRAVNGACSVGAIGSGGGAIYLSNAQRDVAVVLTPLGAARVSAWNRTTGQWD